MVLYCIAYNCTSRKREKGVGFHRFPHGNPKLLKLWIAKLKWKDWTPGLNTQICSKHFEGKYLDLTGLRPRLLPGAVPTIFDFPDTFAKTPRKPLINPRSKRATTDPKLLQSLDYGPKKHMPGGFNQAAFIAQSKALAQAQQQQRQQLLQAGSIQVHNPRAGSYQKHLQTGSSLPHTQIEYSQAQLQTGSLQVQNPPAGSSQIQAQAGSSQTCTQTGSSKTHTQTGSSEQQPLPRKQKVKPIKSVVSKEKQPPPPEPETSVEITWTILGDELKKRTLPSFFHSHYCIPQSFHWSGDADANFEPLLTEKSVVSTVPHIIKITGRWQWLGLDFRGPLPESINGDRFLLTVTDYHSKWVEAFPVANMVSPESAGILCDLFAQFGYPFGVLSRLKNHSINNLNKLFRLQLNRRGLPSGNQLIVYHRQTAFLDSVTELRINSMLSELVRDHPDTWNIHLPGCVLRLCCTEHPDIGTSPFFRMCLREPRQITHPRHLPFSPAIVEDSSFVIDFSEKTDSNQEQNVTSQVSVTDTMVTEDEAGERTSNGEGGSNEEEQSR